MRSTDDGLTWSKPSEITHAFEPFREKYDWKVIATGPGHGIQLKSGRLVVPIWLAYGKLGDHHPSAVGTITSDNHGDTWQAGDLAVPNEGEFGDPSETILTELSDGRVMLVSRSVSKSNRKLISLSPDGARNWSTPFFHEQLWEPVCMASIIAHPSAPGTLIFSNPHSLRRDQDGKEIPAGRGRRENLSIKLSRDNGKTWPINKTLERGSSAYWILLYYLTPPSSASMKAKIRLSPRVSISIGLPHLNRVDSKFTCKQLHLRNRMTGTCMCATDR